MTDDVKALAERLRKIDAAYKARDEALILGTHKEAASHHVEFHRLVYGNWPFIRQELTNLADVASQREDVIDREAIARIARTETAIEGDALAPQQTKGLLVPMGDGPLGRRVWDTWQAGFEGPQGGITLGTNDHTESFCRLSGYLRNAGANARRLCACWNAFIGVPLEDIERIARERSGWVAPDNEDMWRHPDAPPTKTIVNSVSEGAK